MPAFQGRARSLRVEEVADHLGFGPRTIRNFIIRGTRPSEPDRNVRLEATRYGRSWRIRPEDLAAFEAKLRALS